MLKSIAQGLTKPISDIIEKAVKDKDLSAEINRDIMLEIISAEKDYTAEVASIIRAEANSQSWLARNWRPLMMVWFGILLGLYFFGFAPDYLLENPPVMDELFALLKLGIGGYIIGRSGEKIVTTLSQNGGIKQALGN